MGTIAGPAAGVGRRGDEPYRRRRPLPAIAVLVVLAVAVVVVWVRVLGSDERTVTATACPPPAAPTAAADPAAAPVTPGTAVDPSQLDSTPPAAPATVTVRVLNANGESGQAGTVSAQLGEYGFLPSPDGSAGNDTVYADQNLACVGQVRFGPAGVAAARTLGLVVPCAELVQDTRPDAGVDLALGTSFAELDPDPTALAVLTALGQDGTQVSEEQLTAARSTSC